MEDQVTSSNNEQKRAQILCEECNSKEFKYKCPACSRRTCSLPCVNSHKQSSGCTGKKNTTHFIPLSQFDDSTLLSDYNLLEDVKRVAESARRMRFKLCGYHPFYLKTLRGTALRKGMNLLLLPSGMTKREKNQTRYNQRGKSISWTIEWRFHSTDVALLEHGVHESTTLRSVIEKHLQPSPWRNKLRRFCEVPLDNLKLFIRKYHKVHQNNHKAQRMNRVVHQKYHKGNKSPYRELDLDSPLSHLLRGLDILEYPVIHVFLSSDNYDFEVVKDIKPPPPPTIQDFKNPEPDNTAIPACTTFKEEEIIEDEGAPGPLIIDLLKFPEKDEHKTNLNGAQLVGKQLNDSPKHLHSRKSETDGVSCNVGLEVEMLDVKEENFDFDQDLIEAYSFLMEQSNPDDFLDYKFEAEGVQEERVGSDVCIADVEDLEEGEIPNSD